MNNNKYENMSSFDALELVKNKSMLLPDIQKILLGARRYRVFI